MSHKVRILISDAIDGRVYHDYSVESPGDYKTIPGLVRRANEEVEAHLMRVGAYALVHGRAPLDGEAA